MITTKERAILKGIAVNLSPIMQIGKEGLTDNVLNQIDEMLFNREIIKINILKNCDFNAKEAISIICEKINCEPVQAIGNKIVIYKHSNKKDIKHIL